MAAYEISLNFVALVKTEFNLACFRKALKEESEQRPYPTTVRKWLPHDITNPDEGGLYWISVEEHDGWKRFQFSSTVNPGEPGDIMVRVDAAPDAIVTDRAKSDGPINDAINDAISEAINEAIKRTPGINKPKLVKLLGKSKATVERAIFELIASSRIEHRGSNKTGGYYLR